MGNFSDNPVSAAGDPARLSDLHCQHENTLELKRSFERFHEFATTGANSGIHDGIAYYQGHFEYTVKDVVVGERVTYLDTIDTNLFGSGDDLWRMDVAAIFQNEGETNQDGLHHRITWGGTPSINCWSGCLTVSIDAGAPLIQGDISNTINRYTDEDTLPDSISVLAVLTTPRLIGKLHTLLLKPGTRVVLDYAIYKLS